MVGLGGAAESMVVEAREKLEGKVLLVSVFCKLGGGGS
jgi:hypothetical protein